MHIGYLRVYYETYSGIEYMYTTTFHITNTDSAIMAIVM